MLATVFPSFQATAGFPLPQADHLRKAFADFSDAVNKQSTATKAVSSTYAASLVAAFYTATGTTAPTGG